MVGETSGKNRGGGGIAMDSIGAAFVGAGRSIVERWDVTTSGTDT